MTALELYKFITDNEIEWHYDYNGSRDKLDVIVFVHTFQLDYFRAILPLGIFDDSGIECRMKDGYFCFWMKDICEYSGIELSEVFNKDE